MEDMLAPRPAQVLAKQASINRSRAAIQVLNDVSELLRSQSDLLASCNDNEDIPAPELQKTAVQRFLSRRLSRQSSNSSSSGVPPKPENRAPEVTEASVAGGFGMDNGSGSTSPDKAPCTALPDGDSVGWSSNLEPASADARADSKTGAGNHPVTTDGDDSSAIDELKRASKERGPDVTADCSIQPEQGCLPTPNEQDEPMLPPVPAHAQVA